MTRHKHLIATPLFLVMALNPSTSFSYFIDGNGYFGARGETRVNPNFQKDRGTYQATELTFDLNGEIRANDRASFNLRLGIFDDETYLGDKAKPTTCSPRRTGETNPDGSEKTDESCEGRHQSSTNPGYESYKPEITEAYAKYAFNYCLLTVGRRSRDIGLGLLHSAAKKPFEKDPSIFDGVTCDVNIQKQQDLGFYFGFDKLQETGTYTDNPYDQASDPVAEAEYAQRPQSFGPNKASDDMDQFFFGITLDDLKSKGPGAAFAKQVGIYFSNILGTDSKTDVKYLDLYTGLYSGRFAFRNEVVFRMGKSADPNVYAIGGQGEDLENGGTATNNLQSIGLAGDLEYTWSRSGTSIGPTEFNEGNATRHVSFLTYAYAPGDSDGYYGENDAFADKLTSDTTLQESRRKVMSSDKRNNNAKGMAFHRNYKPAMLFFNSPSSAKYLNRGGVSSPNQLTNVSLFTLGYRYESQENGNFEVKLVTGRLLEPMPGEIKDWYTQREGLVAQRNAELNQASSGGFRYSNIDRPMGYAGQDLGYELDLLYTWQYRREVELGAGLAGALPGNAWRISADASPTMQFGIMGNVALKF